MKKIMLGNEAIARGAWEAGCRIVSSYPGTPSTEITEFAASYPEINCEWACNEKVATEVTFGAAMAGARSMTAMKHVGVNVAADPIYTASYTGVSGGMVIVCADDPAMHSSQNEQDSRLHARAAHIPMLEPSNSDECREFMVKAFDISEKYDTPVFVRTTTRISHARTVVNMHQRQEHAVKPYKKDVSKYVMMPGMARKRHPIVEQRMIQLANDTVELGLNSTELHDTSVGIVTSGPAYNYVRDAVPELSVYKLDIVNPLPIEEIRKFSQKVDRLIVIEELEPVIEDQLKVAGIKCEGVNLTGKQGELSIQKVKEIFGVKCDLREIEEVAIRPPVLCPGCPHTGIFNVIHDMKLNVMGDIGCYTMAALPPLSAMDAALCMGASIGMAFGAEKAQGKEFSKHTVAVIGDSTFIHSGITGLIDAVYNHGSITVLILDNRITAMTGHQQNPLTGKDIYNNPSEDINLEKLVSACGVKHISVVDPYDRENCTKLLAEETARDEVSVIIVRRPCVLIKK